MKLVLAGSRGDYQRFIDILWEKDKDISNYIYIGDFRDLDGYSGDGIEFVKLSSFERNPSHQEMTIHLNYRYRGWDARRSTRPTSGVRMSSGSTAQLWQGTVQSAESRPLTRMDIEDARDRIYERSGISQTSQPMASPPRPIGEPLYASHAEHLQEHARAVEAEREAMRLQETIQPQISELRGFDAGGVVQGPTWGDPTWDIGDYDDD